MMQNSIMGIEQNRPENHQKEQTAADWIVAQVIVQPLLLRRGRFIEDEKRIRSVERAGKIWIRSGKNACAEGERDDVMERGRIGV